MAELAIEPCIVGNSSNILIKPVELFLSSGVELGSHDLMQDTLICYLAMIKENL